MNPRNRKLTTEELERLLQQQAVKITQLEKGQTVEVALEKVRSQTMAMHRSEELGAIVAILYKELDSLGLSALGFELILFKPANNILEYWSNPALLEQAICYKIPRNVHPLFEQQWLAWENQQERLIIKLTGQEKLDFDTTLFTKTPFRDLPEEIKKVMGGQIAVTFSHVFMKYGFLEAIDFKPLSEDEFLIVNRFAKVFEQTYTRFLDLKKVEAQAKEAQIEAALERVRAQTMAMYKSEELSKVASAMFKEFYELNLINEIARTLININHEENGDCTMWLTEIGGAEISTNFKYNYLEHELWEAEYFAYQKVEKNKRKEHKYIVVHEGKAFEELIALGIEKKIVTPADIKIIKDVGIQKWIEHIVWFAYGSLVIARDSPLSEEDFKILQRFTAVFEQTYTRFLDLQKAEAQAREAQIEAALERVRARAMSMRHSNELSDAAELLYQEFSKLGVKSFSCGYLLNDEEQMVWDIYLTNPGETAFKEFWKCPMDGDAFLKARYQSWKNKESFHCAILEGEANRKHHEFISQFAPWKVEMVDSLPPKLVFNSAHFSLGHLLVITLDKMTGELEQAMIRFAGVFDLTYRRFLDLEKAEAQNRQLEKVFNENQRLLHSILPKQIAEQIRAGQQTIVKRFEQVSILFADIVGFTVLSEKISPQEVVDILNGLFSKFDDLTDKYQLEKIKTIGDAYMVAAGVPQEKDNHAQLMFVFAKEMLQTLQDFNQTIGTDLKIRIGISSGPVVAGVIGKKKFAYDLWGDTVNTAARMEANGQADCIQISPTTYKILKKVAVFEKIPNVEIKGKGMMDVYLWKP